MNDRLKIITDQLYKEGLEKGEIKASKIIEEANQEAEKIINSAKEKAKVILDQGESELLNRKKKIETEIKLASKQIVANLKNSISNLISDKITDKAVKQALGDKEFIQKLILNIIDTWIKSVGDKNHIDLSITFAESMKADLESFLMKSCKNFLDNGLELQFSENIEAGMKIGPKDTVYAIEFSDESFINYLNEFLRPKTKEFLFN